MRERIECKCGTGYRLLLYGAVIIAMGIFTMLMGCGVEKTDGKKVQDLNYEMVEEEGIPEELKEKIEEKKASDFKLTFESDRYLYVVRGYGEQETGGYSIQIADFYLTKNAIIFDTNLIGPQKESISKVAPSFPYVIIRTANREENVIFQ